ncbi:beta-N-acetylhexosaminidase [Altererythrobacter aurantiacus]|uniref:beta-N-acetylhexosaminidase n=1 Tax=Parapontixanthobacter aurantiacus TaxID=1463599 RepID=A0A844Z7T7_9SPHN|nr:beta-N-acetylhexosaminidase [Parapontixanthobacter aurantiacus]MXO84661.1 beta-N-acetylhexosaminidase [Parapontixanthobacter aurantiacus]
MTPVIFGIAGERLSPYEAAFFKDADPAGYILFGRNCIDREQMLALTDELRALHGRERLYICIDQEGGRVARMKPPQWPAFPAGAVFDALYQVAPASAIEAARANAEALGRELAAVGITADCHPPLDVGREGAHDVIGDRALGSNARQVAAIGRAILDGLERAGVAGCIKHMPGHGRSSVDTHKELPRVTASAAELAEDIAPFKALNTAPAGMTGHLIFTAWDEDHPATLSSRVISEIIRGEIGFDGLLMTDDIDMEALSGTIPERGAAAIAAGCDLVLNCWAKMDDMKGLAERLPEPSEKGKERLEAALARTRLAPGEAQEGERTRELLARRDALIAAAGVAA